jgi:hypothetical protein
MTLADESPLLSIMPVAVEARSMPAAVSARAEFTFIG